MNGTGVRSRRLALLALVATLPGLALATPHKIVDTGQQACYDNVGNVIADPSEGSAFHGQDAQRDGYAPDYVEVGDRLAVFDRNTGLTWQRSPDLNGDGSIEAADQLTWTGALEYVEALNAGGFAGFDDWRLPSIRELYSLMLFTGVDPSGWAGEDTSELTPFLDTDYFEFAYGDTQAGQRVIDAQYWSSTAYISTTMGGDATAFGVNFADGRIKGYPAEPVGPPGSEMTMTGYVRYVRGNPDYDAHEFVANGDGTVTDLATGLMWQQDDDGIARNWEAALAYCEDLVLAGCEDWHLPNAKELQSIVDYSRSPDTTGSAAIDPIFGVTAIIDEGGGTNYPFYWTGTTHANWTSPSGHWAVYIAFGEALGWMQPPFGGGYVLQDVHGAGAQRSDPKYGSAADWPYGNGPQGDVVRVEHHVRCVRSEPVPACALRLDGAAAATSLVLYPDCPEPLFDVVSGRLSELRADGDFRNANCLGSFVGEGDDDRELPVSDGYYYLARGLDGACATRGYASGRTSANGRDELETAGPCP